MDKVGGVGAASVRWAGGSGGEETGVSRAAAPLSKGSRKGQGEERSGGVGGKKGRGGEAPAGVTWKRPTHAGRSHGSEPGGLG